MSSSHCTFSVRAALAVVLVSGSLAVPDSRAASVFDWPQHDWSRPRPAIVDPGTPSTPERVGKPPSDATALIPAEGLAGWVSLDGSEPKWVNKEGVLECAKNSGYIRTVQAFGDCQLHVEFATPTPPAGRSQGRGNSGVFLMGLYEVQVLDSYENVTYADGQAAAAYGQHPPLVNASRPPGQWQTYDILFTRPRFNDRGEVESPARFTVLHNGVLVQHHVELVGPTGWLKREAYARHADKLPLSLQDHGNPVRYRNLWVRELGGDARRPEFVYDRGTLDKVAGTYRAGDDLRIRIARNGNLLEAVIGNVGRGVPFPLHAAARDRFYIRSFDGEFTFKLGADGVPESGTFHIGGEDRALRRE